MRSTPPVPDVGVFAKRGPGPLEGAALRAWDGLGAVRVIDERDDVLLLERAVPGTATTDDAVLAAALRRLWVVPPPDVPWPVADVLCERWATTIERTLRGPLAAAAAAAFRLGLPAGERRLLHGDGHHGNVLDGGARGWLAIDPQPLIGPPVLDLVPALYNGPEAPVAERIAVLATAAAVDADQLRVVAGPRCVLSAAWSVEDGDVALGQRALRVAEELLSGT